MQADPGRLVARPFLPGTTNFAGDLSRVERLIRRVLELPRDAQEAVMADLSVRLRGRFTDIEGVWMAHFVQAWEQLASLESVTDPEAQRLVGAYLTQMYAYEAAALTNPSMVPWGPTSPDGSQPFVMSARAIGEGHVSSIAFFTGSIDGHGEILLHERHPHVSNGTRQPPDYSRKNFTEKLVELGFMSKSTEDIMRLLPETFTPPQLDLALKQVMEGDHDEIVLEDAVKRVHWLAASNYKVTFDESLPISEHLISPAAPIESDGMEDARFVRFTDDDGAVTYYATYTAYDGVRILPQLIETRDFHRFRMATMTGPAVHHKGMAIFPRKIQGEFVALSRHDHERSFILRSDDVRTWSNSEFVFGPEYEWEAVQVGNCGSPIETDDGWLVITHGVGPMRRYVLGAILLDLDEPAKVVGRLRRPFLEPEADETIGYVPDVVYSCGSMVHQGNLITPFGYSDVGIKIAVTPMAELIGEME